MRVDMRLPCVTTNQAATILVAMVMSAAMAVAARPARAQSAGGDGPVLRARHLASNGQVKVFSATGSVHLIGWDRDSIVVRGRVARGERFYLVGSDSGVKLGLNEHIDSSNQAPCDLVIYLPKGARLALKTVSADVTGRDVSGWFYSVSGAVRLGGSASSLDVLSMSGAVELDATTPFVRARTGDGHLALRGSPQDADVSTIGGVLDISTPAVMRGQFATVSGDIHYRGAPAAGAIFDFSSHGGAVDLQMPPSVSGRFTLSTVTGPIENGFGRVRPAAASPNALTLTLGGGNAHVTVRTFKGAIRLRVE
jgi:hypothetical protein